MLIFWLPLWLARTAAAEALTLAAGVLAEAGWRDTAIDCWLLASRVGPGVGLKAYLRGE